MTLIAAFRCDEGVVICADTQETVGDVRVSVNKVVPEDAGAYSIAVAGTGNGDLIEGFAYLLKMDVESWPVGLDEKAIYGKLQAILHQYYENEVRLYPTDSAEDKKNDFLVCIKPKNSPQIFLWTLRSTVIVPVGDHVLLGVGASIYDHELKRLYRKRLSGLQAVLLGIHLFSLAKETSNYIGGPTDVIFVNEIGMYAHRQAEVEELERRANAFNEKVAELLLAGLDTATPQDRLGMMLESFTDWIMQLREQWMRRIMISMAVDIATKDYPIHPYKKLALGTSFILTEAEIEEINEGVDEGEIKRKAKYKSIDKEQYGVSFSPSASPSPSPSASPIEEDDIQD